MSADPREWFSHTVGSAGNQDPIRIRGLKELIFGRCSVTNRPCLIRPFRCEFIWGCIISIGLWISLRRGVLVLSARTKGQKVAEVLSQTSRYVSVDTSNAHQWSCSNLGVPHISNLLGWWIWSRASLFPATRNMHACSRLLVHGLRAAKIYVTYLFWEAFN